MKSVQTRSADLRLGASPSRPDGLAKTNGSFEFSSDLWQPHQLFGCLVRALVPRGVIRQIDTNRARAMPGVRGIVTAADLPGSRMFGIHTADQPVFACEEIRYSGEVVAAVAAEDAVSARRAADAVEMTIDALPALVDPEAAVTGEALHPAGNTFRHIHLRHGDLSLQGEVVVEGTYEVGIQDQAFLGPESGLAVPRDDGGVELIVGSQALHSDRRQIAACLGLPDEMVHLTLGGVGGAFGGKEDLTVHIPLALLAMKTGRPVKMCFDREDSFLGHVHRHPGRLWFRHHATRSGKLIKVEAKLLLDGGAYESTSYAVAANAVCFAAGPYRVDAAEIDGRVVRTNNPPAGAMRGFGAVQVCIGYEAQMDKLAASTGLHPVDIRIMNALRPGDRIITGQQITGTAPVERLLRTCSALPLPPDADRSLAQLPGAVGRSGDATRVRRGVGFAAGVKNILFGEGADDYSTARCRIEGTSIILTCAAVEFGQGFLTVARQIAYDVFGTDRVCLESASTRIGSAGSSSASRQTWMSGGAILSACEAVRNRLLEAASLWLGIDKAHLAVADGAVVCQQTAQRIDIFDLGAFDETREYHHKMTTPLDMNGQGDAHVSFAFAVHRAVVDVDLDLGLVKVVDITTSQDCGKVMNRKQVIGQIEGGIAQGVGLAVMEELLLHDGVVVNSSFTDYLIPTIVDMPPVRIAALIEEPEPGAPYGAKGVGEPPTVSSTAAVLAAIRDATGLPVNRAPVRPDDLVFGSVS